MLGTLGTPEMIAIFFLALILFGPKELPKLGRNIGKFLSEFRRASNELKATFDREMRSLESESESLREVKNQLQEATNQYQYNNYNYDYASYEATYEGAYGSENYDSSAPTPSTASATATEGAQSPSVVPPEGTVAHGTEVVAVSEPGGHTPAPAVHAPDSPPAEHS